MGSQHTGNLPTRTASVPAGAGTILVATFSSVWSMTAAPAGLQTGRMGRDFLPLTCFVLAVARKLTLRPVGQLQVGFWETDGADRASLLGALG